MNRICGIEFKSSEAILVVLEHGVDGFYFIDIEPRKIKLGDDESIEYVRSFYNSVVNFIKDNHIEMIVIKKRAKKGTMAGGAVSFKMEALVQLNGVCDVSFISGQGIAAANKRDPFIIPNNIKKYQEAAFMSAELYLRKN
ncbi:DUF3010 family protein [Leucothrix arctica]|uniref:DUF3010 domain-containing protein n=1 Tax=Leucothrix arctica TaxID=1481894 RepID=A0A317C4N2_9GAMM|nr:DUF3010 family protein [Leucothrix arctica]PWQ93605.1 DUF3010 domain-containing protein [Leucothrix arctica]